MTQPIFHISLAVKSIEASVDFYTKILKAKLLYRDPSGYVNIDWAGCQITLKQNTEINPSLPDFHFGVNMSLHDFDRLAPHILETGSQYVTMRPEIWDAGTAMERKKMYLKCPTGYIIEIKGYR